MDIRADLYSLGCTLFYLLAGRVPFPGGTAAEKLLKLSWSRRRTCSDYAPKCPPPSPAWSPG